MIEKIISGGQNGVDQAALRAARRLGIATGGWAPHGWKTHDGAAPWLADYGLVEHPGDYPARTAANVYDSDATVRIARNFFTPGERCTMRAILCFERPHLDLHVDHLIHGHHELLRFITDHNVRVLNIAGNSEKTAPGIGALVERFLVDAIAVYTMR